MAGYLFWTFVSFKKNYWNQNAMGRIKTRLIKRTAKRLIAERESEFGTDFQENKKKVENVLEFYSKKLRNVVTGYVTKLKKRKK